MKTTCANRFFPCVALTLAVVVMGTSSALAQLSHNLTTISPTLDVVTGQSNLNVVVRVNASIGGSDTDSDNTSISGTIAPNFGIDFTTGDLRVTSFDIQGGRLYADQSMDFDLNISFLWLTFGADAVTNNVSGEPFTDASGVLTTPARHGVTGMYAANHHGLELDMGTITVTGDMNRNMNLANDPISGLGSSTEAGQVILTRGPIDLEANTTTYSLTTVLPIGVVYEESNNVSGINVTTTITGNGSVRSTSDLVFDWVPWNGIAGDINQDGALDPLDIDAFVGGWRSTNDTPGLQAYMLGDMNFDGVTDLYDAALLRNALMGTGLSMGPLASLLSGAAAVPEPATWATGLIGVGLLLAARRRLRCRA